MFNYKGKNIPITFKGDNNEISKNILNIIKYL